MGGYNTVMKQEFIKKNIKQEELLVISKWTKESSDIKNTMWGVDNLHKKEADIMFSLFDNYQSNVTIGTVLYRGMAVPEDLFLAMEYDKLTKGSHYTPDEVAISSFSKSKKIAFEFAMEGDSRRKVILKIYAKDENLLDITSFSEVEKEEENILHKNIWYNVVKIKSINRGGIEWLLMELK